MNSHTYLHLVPSPERRALAAMAQIAKYREAQIELERIHLRAVGALLANGWTNRRIADLLNLSQWQARKLARQARENGLV